MSLWKEALEAFADERNWRFNGRFDPNSPNFDGIKTALRALQELEEDELKRAAARRYRL